jgi:hypothetical protein
VLHSQINNPRVIETKEIEGLEKNELIAKF